MEESGGKLNVLKARSVLYKTDIINDDFECECVSCPGRIVKWSGSLMNQCLVKNERGS